MFKLSASPQFLSEFNNFKFRISKIEDEASKMHCEILLKALESKVKLLDVQHNEMTLNNRLPPVVVETRSDIVEIRKQLDRKIKEAENNM